jgi:tetratricopeptide (TPR) repeat protein
VIQPGNVNALTNKGVTLAKRGEHVKAIEIYDQLLKQNPTDRNILHNKALALSNSQMFDEGRAVYDYILSLDPNMNKAIQGRCIFMISGIYSAGTIFWNDDNGISLGMVWSSPSIIPSRHSVHFLVNLFGATINLAYE